MEKSNEKNNNVIKISLKKLILIIILVLVIVSIIGGVIIYKEYNDTLNHVNIISKKNMKRITQEDEEKIITLLEITKEEFESYKQYYTTLSKDVDLTYNTRNKKEIEDIAKENFNALENYILMYDENLMQFIKNNISSSDTNKYETELLNCYAISGIIDSYFKDDNYDLKLVQLKESGYNPKLFTINNKNLVKVVYNDDNCWVYIYKGIEYDYTGDVKPIFEVLINSANELKFWDSFKNIPLHTSDKPIIYLYPEEKMKVNVKLGRSDKLTCSYPKYEEKGWNIIAEPSGRLTDIDTGRELYCLYWEGKNTNNTNINEGFVVKGEDTIRFLEEKLEILGLNEKEAQEFIIYWLPQMEDNEYNYIRFETIEEINENMPLEITPTPDNIIRINMVWKALDKHIEVKEQLLEKTPRRTGFTVVEWGGTKLN